MLQVVETHPYEKLSHAVVAWVDENLDRCDIIHTHEWGGVFTDLATLVNFRQLKPGESQLQPVTAGDMSADSMGL